MLNEFNLFGALCVSMFFASYLIGYLPLIGNLGKSKIRLISVFGAGLLIGTAFAVVVPEGIDALHSSVSKEAKHSNDALEVAIAKEASRPAADAPKEDEVKKRIPEPLKKLHPHLSDLSASHDHEHAETGRTIGVTILIGFLFMLVVDQISKTACGGGRRKLSTTIGLCVHALADGVLLGSASSTNNSEVQMVVFIALIIHKGPSAFALSSLLLMENLERFRIKRHLLVFSLSAPIGALITYMSLAAVEEGAEYSKHLSGLFMLFSAGTFVYVAAAHVLPELVEHAASGYDVCPTSSSASLSASVASAGITVRELFVLFCGALAPCFLVGDHHHH